MRGLELKIPPLALVLLTAALMWLSARTAPTFTSVIPLRNSIAVAIALLGAATSILGVVSFRRAGTTVNDRAFLKCVSERSLRCYFKGHSELLNGCALGAGQIVRTEFEIDLL